MPSINPELRRLLPEVFRRVAVPYNEAGLLSGSGRYSLGDVADVVMGHDPIVRQDIAQSRLATPGIGTWSCPKLRAGPPAKNAQGRQQTLALHTREYSAPGTCQDIETKTGKPCGLTLRPKKSHLDLFAEGFGFLEKSGNSYIRGKFGAVAAYLRTVENKGRYFDSVRASTALLLYAVLERHGDCVLPLLATRQQPSVDAFQDNVRRSIAFKTRRLETSQLPRNAAFNEMMLLLDRFTIEWGAEQRKALRATALKAKPLERKTILGYQSRTRSYLLDLGLISLGEGAGAEITLTERGKALLGALGDAGIKVDSSSQNEIPPTFEAIHDAFGSNWQRYSDIFAPSVSSAVSERIVRGTLMPNKPPIPWESVRSELSRVYDDVIRSVGESISQSARIDLVRLSLFLYALGIGAPVEMEDEGAEPGEGSLARNAAVTIGLSDASRYVMGHSRTGQRFWSVTLRRS